MKPLDSHLDETSFASGASHLGGLTTESAIERLCEEIEQELNSCKCEIHGKSGLILWLRSCFSHSSVLSTFRWPSVLLLLTAFVIFVISYCCGEDDSHLTEALLLLVFLFLNLVITGIEIRLRHEEVHRKARFIVEHIKEGLVNRLAVVEEWKTGKYYPLLHLPQSPCITLQWTLRDNKRINLPATLLVKGDVVYLCPGHVAPGSCQNIETKNASDPYQDYVVHKHLELKRGDTFAPSLDSSCSAFTGARLRKAMKPTRFLMLETPYISALRLALETSFKRPATLFEKERHTIVASYMEQIIIPLIWIVGLCVSFLHYGYLNSKDPDSGFSPTSMLLLVRPTLTILPLLPLTLSLVWLLLNAVGMARLVHYINVCNVADSHTLDRSIGFRNSMQTKPKQNGKELYYDDLDENSMNNSVEPAEVSWLELYKNTTMMLTSKGGHLWRSANLLQVLGSITTLCCVDKKGILSWPNPTADKIFFLTSAKSDRCPDESSDDEIFIEGHQLNEDSSTFSAKKPKYYSGNKAEVLDITHDPHTSHGIQFDDPEWKRFLPSLKPIGLNILLNTCNVDVQEEYTQFCDHITCESLKNEAAVPVVNKRCLCELARQIGFAGNAVAGYDYQFQISSFRHIKAEIIRQGKLAKSLNIPRLKMPFPNMSSSVIKDTFSCTYQLFSQGTGDLVLDSCTEFWNGQDLCILNENDRKRILDFYHRSSLTANCMAFSYVPLTFCPSKKITSDYYIELPPDSSHLFRSQKSLNSSLKSWEFQKDYLTVAPSHHLSTDSVAIREYKSQEPQPNARPMSAASDASVDNYHLGNLLNQLNNQVFIGMVTMQYQACTDFVKMIEQLEKACIRFVHFSKENELRSRVFSEKMGLESGWNCHISLLSERTRSDHTAEQHQANLKNSKYSLSDEKTVPTSYNLVRSQSAPSYVNMEMNVVKFDDEPLLKESCQDVRDRGDCLSMASSGTYNSGKEAARLIPGSPRNENMSPSTSHISSNTENSAPINFDMSNRSKLPKGIENIRPHLKNIDNVPLLVSLFTDCTPETTTEMIKIMQENGEIVCVLGSSANFDNMRTFLQADASIGIEPLYPQVCITQPIIEASATERRPPLLTPMEVAKHLNCLPCSIHFNREDPISLKTLIAEARHYMMNARNSLQFYLCCSLSLSLAQLFASLLFLPPLFSAGQVLWFVCIILPILSFSLMGSPQDPQLMTVATGKNLHLTRENLFYFLWCYFAKFSPSVIVVVACFALIITSLCKKMGHPGTVYGPCWIEVNSRKQDAHWSFTLLVCQTMASFFLFLYFVVISIGFVHRSHIIWERSPLLNRWWLHSSIVLLLLHTAFCIMDLVTSISPELTLYGGLSVIPLHVFVLGIIWPFVCVVINMLVKRYEIKVHKRQQRRAKLDFGTKLGMNSPF